MILQAKNFSSRNELEDKLKTLIPLTPDAKDDYQIKGTKEELAVLHLSDTTVFWGVKCICTDFPTEQKTQKDVPKPFRGEVVKSGLNLDNTNTNINIE